MYTINDISGAVILNQIDRASIGKWNEAKINNDKTVNGGLSVIGLAVTYYGELAVNAGVDLNGLSASNTDTLNASLIWYISGQYKKRDIEDKAKELCSEDDYRLQANLYNRACEFLKKVSPAMASLADFCKFEEENLQLDDDAFGIVGFTAECNDVNEYEGETIVSTTTTSNTISSGGTPGVTDHGALSGLLDDDHTQYSLIASGAAAPVSTPSRVGLIYVDTANDNIYISKGTDSSADWNIVNAGGGGGVSDHGALTGLGDDDHPQYSAISSGAGAPATTPSRVGLIYIDTTAKNIYMAKGTSSSADWERVNLDTDTNDHGSLIGLGDDDHTQYHNDSRGDIRYYRKTEFINSSSGGADSGKPVVLDGAGKIDESMIEDSDINHSNLSGLINDDHSQYTIISSGSGVPASTPVRVGALYVDIANDNIYVATGTGSSADWTQANSGGGVSDHGALSGLGDDDHSQYSIITNSPGVPAATPPRAGAVYVDTTNGDIYIAKAATGSSDWIKVGDYSEIIRIADGMAFDKHDIYIVESGGTVYFEMEKTGGGDVSYFINNQKITLDCTTGSGTGGRARIALTAGSAFNDPELNYVYITESAGSAVLNTAGVRPSGAFAWVAKIVIPDATTFLTTGAYETQRFTESFLNDSRGALSHQREKLRELGALYLEGITPTLSITTNAGTPDNVHVQTTAGKVFQLHKQDFPAFTAGPYFVGNGNSIFTQLADLNEVLDTQDGTPFANNDRFNIVIGGSVNHTTGECKLFINKPYDTYGSDAQALADVNNTADYTVPTAFRTTAFLISRNVMKYTTASGGTWTSLGTFSLLGTPLGTRSGGATVIASNEFPDGSFEVFNTSDTTKRLDFNVGGVTTATTRTITIADQDIDMTPDSGSYQSSGTYSAITQGSGAPVSTPSKEGDIYIDTTNDNVYIAKGTASSADWEQVNGGGGTSDHGALSGLTDDDHTQYPIISSGAGAPISTPARIGALYFDTTNKDQYCAFGTSSSADWVLQGQNYFMISFATNGTLTDNQIEWDIGRNVPLGTKDNGGIESADFDLVIYSVNVFLETAPTDVGGSVLQIYENFATERQTITIPQSVLNYNETFSAPITISAGNFWFLRTKTAGGAGSGVATFVCKLVRA